MARMLPAEVLLNICEELSNRQDFNTLFNCALTGRHLSGPALLWLYRDYQRSDPFEGNDDEFTRQTLEAQRKHTSRWILLWQSLIRSSLGTTAYPYCMYIRSLDLTNLETLLSDSQFREVGSETFFAEDMAKFRILAETPSKKRTRHYRALDIHAILDMVGESITNFVSEAADRNHYQVALEDLSGRINTADLARWTSRLPRLKSMTLWDGAVMNEEIGNAISHHCPDFDDLTFFLAVEDDFDSRLAAFFGALRSQTLRSFTAIRAQKVGPQSFLALSNHSSTLRNLKLHDLKTEAIEQLSLLQSCKDLEVLSLEDNDGFIHLEATQNDIFLEVVAWLNSCKRLQELRLQKFNDAPAILTQLCIQSHIKLKSLDVIGYPLPGNQDFHKALAHQTSLEALFLAVDSEDAFRDDIDTFISSLSRLTNLKKLVIQDSLDFLRNSHISVIASSLQKLEELSFSGDVDDSIWPSISSLRHLRALNPQGITSFTFDGMLNYISTLQQTNRGLVLTVLSQNGEFDLSDSERAIIRESIIEKVDGRFDFTLWREGGSDYPSDSD